MDRFTEKSVKALKAGRIRRFVWSERAGFGVRVSVKGKKSWVFLYRLDGRQRLLTLGTFPRMSLSDARQSIEAASDMLEHGKDPADVHIEEKAAERAALTVAQLMEEYLTLWAKTHKKSWAEDGRMIEADIVPKWGRRKAKDIQRRDVIELLDSIVARGAPIQANRVLSVARRAFNFAIERDILKTNPCNRVRPPAPERRKNRALSASEITSLWNGAGKSMKPVSTAVLKTILVTGQRPGEVAGMHTSEIDDDIEWWTIPEGRAKNKRSHRVPLTALAREIIKDALGSRQSPCFVFASTHKPGAPITRHSVAAAMRRNCPEIGIDPATPHDLRRTFTTEGGAIGIPREYRRRVLNHTDSDVTAIYDHYGYDKEKREALESWEKHINELTKQ